MSVSGASDASSLSDRVSGWRKQVSTDIGHGGAGGKRESTTMRTDFELVNNVHDLGTLLDQLDKLGVSIKSDLLTPQVQLLLKMEKQTAKLMACQDALERSSKREIELEFLLEQKNLISSTSDNYDERSSRSLFNELEICQEKLMATEREVALLGKHLAASEKNRIAMADENAKLKTDLTQSAAEISQLQKSISVSESQKLNEISREVISLGNQLSHLENRRVTEVSALRDDLHRRDGDISLLRAELQTSERQISHLHTTLSNLEKIRAQNSSGISSAANAEIESLRAALTASEENNFKEAENWRRKFLAAESEAQFEEERREKQTRSRDLERDIADLRMRLRDTERDNAELRNSAVISSTEFQRVGEQREYSVAALRSTISALEAEVRRLNGEIDFAKGEEEGLRKRLESAERAAENLSENIRRKDDEARRVQMVHENEINLMKNAIGGLQKEIETFTVRLGGEREALALREEIRRKDDVHEREEAQREREMESLISAVDELNSNARETALRLFESEREIQNYEIQRERDGQKIAALQNEIENFEFENSNLKTQLISAGETAAILRNELARKDSEFEIQEKNLRNSVETLTNEISNLGATVQGLEREGACLRGEIEMRDGEISNLKFELQLVRDTNSSDAESLAELLKNLENLKEKTVRVLQEELSTSERTWREKFEKMENELRERERDREREKTLLSEKIEEQKFEIKNLTENLATVEKLRAEDTQMHNLNFEAAENRHFVDVKNLKMNLEHMEASCEASLSELRERLTAGEKFGEELHAILNLIFVEMKKKPEPLSPIVEVVDETIDFSSDEKYFDGPLSVQISNVLAKLDGKYFSNSMCVSLASAASNRLSRWTYIATQMENLNSKNKEELKIFEILKVTFREVENLEEEFQLKSEQMASLASVVDENFSTAKKNIENLKFENSNLKLELLTAEEEIRRKNIEIEELGVRVRDLSLVTSEATELLEISRVFNQIELSTSMNISVRQREEALTDSDAKFKFFENLKNLTEIIETTLHDNCLKFKKENLILRQSLQTSLTANKNLADEIRTLNSSVSEKNEKIIFDNTLRCSMRREMEEEREQHIISKEKILNLTGEISTLKMILENLEEKLNFKENTIEYERRQCAVLRDIGEILENKNKKISAVISSVEILNDFQRKRDLKNEKFSSWKTSVFRRRKLDALTRNFISTKTRNYFCFWREINSHRASQRKQISNLQRLQALRKFEIFKKNSKIYRSQRKKADRHFEFHLKKRVFWTWVNFHRNFIVKNRRGGNRALAISRQIQRTFFFSWARRRRLAKKISNIFVKKQIHLVAQFFELWKIYFAKFFRAKKFAENSMKTRTVQNWLEKQNDEKIQRQKKFKVILRWKNRVCLNFFSKWIFIASENIRRKISLKRTVARWRKSGEARCFQFWKKSVENSKNSNRKLFLSVRYWRSKIPRKYFQKWFQISLAGKSAKRKLATCVKIWKRVNISKSLRSWVGYTLTQKTHKKILLKSVRRWTSKYFQICFELWREKIRKINGFRSMIFRMKNFVVGKSFTSWGERTRKNSRRKFILGKSATRLTQRGLSRAFSLWVQNLKIFKNLKHKARTVIRRWLNLSVQKIFDLWVTSAKESKRKSQILMKSVRRMLDGEKIRSFEKWKNATFSRTGASNLKLKILLRWTHQTLATSFLTWSENARGSAARLFSLAKSLSEFGFRIPILSCTFKNWRRVRRWRMARRKLENFRRKYYRKFSWEILTEWHRIIRRNTKILKFQKNKISQRFFPPSLLNDPASLKKFISIFFRSWIFWRQKIHRNTRISLAKCFQEKKKYFSVWREVAKRRRRQENILKIRKKYLNFFSVGLRFALWKIQTSRKKRNEKIAARGLRPLKFLKFVFEFWARKIRMKFKFLSVGRNRIRRNISKIFSVWKAHTHAKNISQIFGKIIFTRISKISSEFFFGLWRETTNHRRKISTKIEENLKLRRRRDFGVVFFEWRKSVRRRARLDCLLNKISQICGPTRSKKTIFENWRRMSFQRKIRRKIQRRIEMGNRVTLLGLFLEKWKQIVRKNTRINILAEKRRVNLARKFTMKWVAKLWQICPAKRREKIIAKYADRKFLRNFFTCFNRAASTSKIHIQKRHVAALSGDLDLAKRQIFVADSKFKLIENSLHTIQDLSVKNITRLQEQISDIMKQNSMLTATANALESELRAEQTEHAALRHRVRERKTRSQQELFELKKMIAESVDAIGPPRTPQ